MSDRLIYHPERGSGSSAQPFVRLQQEDVTGDVLCVLLKRCAPPHVPTPDVLWRCACIARFMREAVREVSRLGGECVSVVGRWSDRMGRTQSWSSCGGGRCVCHG